MSKTKLKKRVSVNKLDPKKNYKTDTGEWVDLLKLKNAGYLTVNFVNYKPEDNSIYVGPELDTLYVYGLAPKLKQEEPEPYAPTEFLNNVGEKIAPFVGPILEPVAEPIYEFGLLTTNLHNKAVDANPNFEDLWKMGLNIWDFYNNVTVGLPNRFSPTQNIGLVIDALLGDNVIQSMLGNSGIVSDNFEKEHPYWSLALNLAGDIGGYSLARPFNFTKPNDLFKGLSMSKVLLNKADDQILKSIPILYKKYWRRFDKTLRNLDNAWNEIKHPWKAKRYLKRGLHTSYMTFDLKRLYLLGLHDAIDRVVNSVNKVSFYNNEVLKSLDPSYTGSPTILTNPKIKFVLRRGLNMATGRYDRKTDVSTIRLSNGSGRFLKPPERVEKTIAHELGHKYSRTIPRNQALTIGERLYYGPNLDNKDVTIFEPIYSKYKKGKWGRNPDEAIAEAIALKHKYNFVDYNALDKETRYKVANEFYKTFKKMNPDDAWWVLSEMSTYGYKSGGKIK